MEKGNTDDKKEEDHLCSPVLVVVKAEDGGANVKVFGEGVIDEKNDCKLCSV